MYRIACCTIGIGMWFAGVACGQTDPLPASLRSHVAAEQFAIVTSVRGLPLGVRSELQTLFGTQTLDIAEPGADFQLVESVSVNLPHRRLAAAGCSKDNHCLVYYERGGTPHTWRVALFYWTPEETKFEWGGEAPGGLKTIEAVRTAVLSGAIKGGAQSW